MSYFSGFSQTTRWYKEPDGLGVLLGGGVMAFPLCQQEAGKASWFLAGLVDVLAGEPDPISSFTSAVHNSRCLYFNPKNLPVYRFS